MAALLLVNLVSLARPVRACRPSARNSYSTRAMINPMNMINLADIVGAIDAIKVRLLNQPDLVAEKLAESPHEFYK